jgi:spore germination protein
VYRRLSAVLFPVVAIALIGAVYWGYQEHQEKNSILIKAENQYQRAFHDLSYHVDQLHEQLGNTLAVNSTSQAYHRKGLINVWRITSQAQSEINQLPLTLLPFNQTEEFLSKIANFSYRTAVRDLTKEPLSDKEYETLKTLYKNSEDISKDLKTMQAKVLDDNLRWMDVELALASEHTPRDNTIIDGFKTVDKKVSEYPEINWGPSVASIYQKRGMSMLSGKPSSPEDIKKAAAKFLGIQDPSGIKVVENGKGTEYASYSATVENGEQEGRIQLDYTKRGSQLIWFMNPRKIEKQPEASMQEAEAAAARFLKQHGYPEMKAVSYDRFDNAVNITFSSVQNGVVIYPEKLTVKVALDQAEVLGLQAVDFVYEHHKRKLAKPAIAEDEARKALNPSFETSGMQMALIHNDLDEEVLCYEFAGRINGGRYKIYINAENGTEEKIERFETGEEASPNQSTKKDK